jgi:hypothetical protein
MPADGEKIVKSFERAKARRFNFDSRWEAMAPYIAPSRMGIITKYAEGEKQTRNVYDSTTMLAAETMAMFIAGNIINPAQRWFDFQMRDPLARQSDATREWLDELRDLTLRRKSASLFYAEGPESLIDYGGFGTGFLLCEEAPQPVNRVVTGFRGFRYEAVKTGRFWLEEGADGLVDSFYRLFEWTARICKDAWGDNPRASLPEKVKQAITEGQLDKPFQFIHSVYPRPRAEQGAGIYGMPWASCWVELESKHLVYESGYPVFPAAVPRYHKTPGEVYGRGRGDIVFPDTWTLNTAKKMGLEDWALKIRPPIFVGNDSVIGSLKLVPGGPTSINRHGGRIQDVVMPFQTGSSPEISQLKEDELRRSIREVFFVETIRQLLQFEERSNTRTTREEFVRKLEILFRLLGPVYGRLEWEFLHRDIDLAFQLQLATGAFPPPPAEVMDTDGQIDVEFQNPIARAQRAGDAESLQLAIGDLTPLANLFPQVFDRLDPDKTADGIYSLRGVPAKWMRDDQEVAAVRVERAKRDERENALAEAEQAAGAVGKMAPVLKALPGGKMPEGMEAMVP